jgi:hypothetical protein
MFEVELIQLDREALRLQPLTKVPNGFRVSVALVSITQENVVHSFADLWASLDLVSVYGYAGHAWLSYKH